MKLALILLLTVTNEVTIAVLVGSEPDLFDPSFNETGNVWNCLGARYQRESVEEMSESVLACAKRNLYRGLLNNLDSECVDIGDGVTFTAETDQVISPREVFPLGRSRRGPPSRTSMIAECFQVMSPRRSEASSTRTPPSSRGEQPGGTSGSFTPDWSWESARRWTARGFSNSYWRRGWITPIGLNCVQVRG